MNLESKNFIGERIFLREMTERDAPYLVVWRNDPEIKRWMFNQDELTLERHISWFRSRKEGRIDYIICEKGTNIPIGTVNFYETEKGVAESGRLIGDKRFLGKGIGLEAGKIWLKAGFSFFQFQKIIARTKSNNQANINLNIKLGFKTVDKVVYKTTENSQYEFLVMELKKEDFHG